MCTFRELSVQSGVSSLIRSSIRVLVMTWEGFCISSFKMAYSVCVSLTGVSATVTEWEAVSRRIVLKQRTETGAGADSAIRSCTVILASSSAVSKGFVI